MEQTLGEIVGKLLAAVGDGTNSNPFCDVMDQEFLYGAWKESMEDMHPSERHFFRRDLRGICWALARMAKGFKVEGIPDSSAMTGSNRQEVKGLVDDGAFSSGAIRQLKADYERYLEREMAPPDISTEETLELTLPNCSANPQCGEDDVICPQCKAGNCPGAKCWRGCNG